MLLGTAGDAPAPVGGIGFMIVLACVCALLAAVLAAAEEAASRVTRAAAQDYAAGSGRGTTVVRIAEEPAPAVRSATYARVLLELVGAVCLTLVIAAAFPRWWQVLLVALAALIILATVVVELLPRALGRRYSLQVLALVGPAVLLVQRGLTPMIAAVRRLAHRRGRSPAEELQEETENLRDMVERVSESDQIDEDEREMLQSVFELGTTRVREVMVPRTDMVTIHVGVSVRKALNLFVRSGYSRVPVVGDSVDDLRGVLYLKDALAQTVRGGPEETTVVEEVMRPPLFVPETKVVDDLLEEMRDGSVHIAIVVDEYGGVAGLVTVEDILEELVGELVDEHDTEEEEVAAADDGTFVVPARLGLDELGELFDIDIEDDEVTTAAGLLTKALGRVPIQGARACTHGICLEAIDFQGRRRRLHALRVWRAETETEAAAAASAPSPASIEAPEGQTR
ncbi:hemolysin family protein [Ruania albidiflava]|uniref:hemolysin family protein n=1 Tax=Ruania albidiflava TaxID=366586 RepID=UPI0003B2EFF0|nr:hemolysin family protein [Ruania albidiflava]